MRSKILIFAIAVTLYWSCGNAPAESDVSDLTQKGMVSTAHPLATQAGLDILKKGGNAFDAAVAIAAALNVVEPMMSGMGGYGTILIYDAEKNQVRYLDSSGKIPQNMNSDLMRPPTPNYLENRRGAKSISTPGNVNAWDAMSSEYGNLKWSELFGNAIQIADSGFAISSRTALFIGRSFSEFSDYSKSFYGKSGNPLTAGERLIQKDLANSFRMLAEQGKAVFYSGELATQISKTMNERESFLSFEDLVNDEAEWWEPIKINIDEYQIFTASPPATAFPSLIRIGLMDQINPESMQHNSTEYLHYFAEATKHAFWSRLRYAGDPEINPPPLDMLLSEDYLSKAVADFNKDSASQFEPPGYVQKTGQNTTHFVVADKWGNIVSATQTLGNLFGSKIMPEGTGIWFNNSLAYSTYEPKGNPMDAIPGQRKLSGDCPTIIFKNEKPWVALGTPGGHTIGQTVPQMVMNLIYFNMDIEEALSSPRVSFIEPNRYAIERDIPDSVFNQLKAKGHEVERVTSLGNAHGLMIHFNQDGTIAEFEGASDPRGEGMAKGY